MHRGTPAPSVAYMGRPHIERASEGLRVVKFLEVLHYVEQQIGQVRVARRRVLPPASPPIRLPRRGAQLPVNILLQKFLVLPHLRRNPTADMTSSSCLHLIDFRQACQRATHSRPRLRSPHSKKRAWIISAIHCISISNCSSLWTGKSVGCCPLGWPPDALPQHLRKAGGGSLRRGMRASLCSPCVLLQVAAPAKACAGLQSGMTELPADHMLAALCILW